MTLSDPNPGFKVTGYLKVEYLADGARVFKFQLYKAQYCRSLEALPKTRKKLGVVAEIFLIKALEGVTPLIENKHNIVSIR